MASGNTVRVILRRIAEQRGLEKVHPHRFRHTFATRAIQSARVRSTCRCCSATRT